MQKVTLSNGVQMPILGLGVYKMENLAECERVVLDALEIGYRLIDTAAIYENEEAVGAAIKKSGVARADIFITTKLWIHDQGYERTRKAFDLSMKKLGLDYLDLYLIHQPFGDTYGSWRAMEELYRAGRVKAIGVSNFYPYKLVDFVLHNALAPMVNQVETHPYYQRAQDLEIMQKYKVQMEAWAPFAQGKNEIFSNSLLKEIAAQYGKTVAQVILRWLIQRAIVAIPKSVHKARLQENFSVFDFALSDKDMQKIKMLHNDARMFMSHTEATTVEILDKYKR